MSFIPIYQLGEAHPQARACAACEVRASALFGVLDGAGLDRIHTHIKDLTLAPGDTVHDGGRTGKSVYTVRAGLIRFERPTGRGDRRIVRLAGRGDLIGQEALLNRPYADEAVACTPAQLCRIPSHLIDTLVREDDALPRELMLRWQVALDAAEAWVADLSTGPARHRLLRLLLRLNQHADAAGMIWLPRRDEIGAMLDLTVETSSRLVSALRRERILAVATRHRAQLDVDALQRALRADGGA